MAIRSSWCAIVVLSVLPNLAVEGPTTRQWFVTSFVPGCEQFVPRVRSEYTAAGRPTPRDASAPVDVYLRGHEPVRPYQVVGKLELLARSRNTSLENLVDHARRTARGMGGDALLETWPRDAASLEPPRGERGRLYLTASVIRWE